MAERAIAELGGERDLLVRGPRPAEAATATARRPTPPTVKLPGYERGREGRHPQGLRRRAGRARRPPRRVVALDGEVGNSTYAEEFAKAYPERYFEMFIAEQQLVAAAVGSARAATARSPPPSPRSSPGPTTSSGWRPSPGPTSAWSARTPAWRSAPTARPRWRWRTWPCCAPCTAPPCSTPATRPAPPPWSRPWPTRTASPTCGPPGAPTRCSTTPARPSRSAGPRCCAPTGRDQVTLIGAGVTLHECLAAADRLAADGIGARVIDLYSVKPVDTATLTAAAAATGGRLVVAEDHHPEGGLGSAVARRPDRRRPHRPARRPPGRPRDARLRHPRRTPRRRRHRRRPHRRGRPPPARGRMRVPEPRRLPGRASLRPRRARHAGTWRR